MNDPSTEIAGVIRLICTARNHEDQQQAIVRYFAPDAGFQHPLCTVKRGRNSRGAIVGIYRWYRNMSPTLDLHVESTKYDEQLNIVYVNIVQTFHVWLSPLKPAPSRLLVRVDLKFSPAEGKYYIVQQTDYYQPEDILALTIPFLISPLAFIKCATGWICLLNAWIYLWLQALALKYLPFSGSNVWR